MRWLICKIFTGGYLKSRNPSFLYNLGCIYCAENTLGLWRALLCFLHLASAVFFVKKSNDFFVLVDALRFFGLRGAMLVQSIDI